MANDKDFILKNAVEVGGPTNVTLGTVTSDNIDLSTGNYFKDTPTGTSTYTISNAGDVQSFQLEVTGGTAEVAQNFSTTLYTGNSTANRDIVNNIDLDGEGGLVWIKNRSSSVYHVLADTERSMATLRLPNTDAEYSSIALSANTDGFNATYTGLAYNQSGDDYVSWTFKKAAGFFDVVTYTGTGSAQNISHNLGSTPAVVIVKMTSNTGGWFVYHSSVGATKYLRLETTGAELTNSTIWNNTAPTDTQFTVGTSGGVNQSGGTYVAYLFAHDTAADSLIKCGSYTGSGSTGHHVDLGFEPQWILVKESSASGDNWILMDSMRGLPANTGTSYNLLFPNLSNAEASGTASDLYTYIDATGFGYNGSSNGLNQSGETYIYIAIRAASEPDITWPSSIEWAGGVAPAAPAVGETDVFTITTDDGGTTYTGVKTADNLS
jgi:hypothetical protein